MKELKIAHPSINAALAMKDGEIVAQSEGIEAPYRQHSITKSLTSLAAGMLLEEGKLSLETKAGECLPLPADAPLAEVTLGEFMSMHSGLARQLLFEDRESCPDYLAACLAMPTVPKRFLYNNADFYLAGLMAEAAAGERLDHFIERHILEPLGITDDAFEYDTQGHFFGASGLKTSTHSLAKLGQSLLEKTLYPAEYLETATHRVTVSDDGRDYGYGFWIYGDVISMNGKWGQHCLIFPKENAIIAVNAHLGSVEEMRTFIRETMLPCIR